METTMPLYEFDPSYFDSEEDAYLEFCNQNAYDPDSQIAQKRWGEYLDYLDPREDPDLYRGEYPE